MLWMLLAIASPAEAAAPMTIGSIADLDKACSTANETPESFAIPLSGTSLSMAETNAKLFPVQGAFPALNGLVLLHWVERSELQWEGKIARKEAMDAYEKGEAFALMRGRFDSEDSSGLPVCFGHPQVDFRSVAMHIDEVIVSDGSGAQIGRLSPSTGEKALPAGGVAQVSAQCGRPCSFTDNELKRFVAQVETQAVQCARGSPAGNLVFELSVGRSSGGVPVIRSEITSLEDSVHACVRTALNRARFRRSSRSGNSEVTVMVSVPETTSTEI